MRPLARIVRTPVALFGVFGALVAGACQTPTQVTLELRTDVPCSSVRGVSITVGSPGTVESASPGTTVYACNDGYIGTLAVVPSGAKDGRLAVRAVLGVDVPSDQCSVQSKYRGCIVVRRELSFVPRSNLLVPIGFYAACRNVACDSNSTCKGRGECVSSLLSNVDGDAGTPPIGDGGSYVCATDKDCPVLDTVPPKCAVGRCSLGECAYSARDEDGDNDRAANCVSQVKTIAVSTGNDCDDKDPTISSKIAHPCTNPTPGCGPGSQTCNPADFRKVGPCVSPSAKPFDCSNLLDNDCNGVVDADELTPIPAVDVGKLCANLYRCPTGSVNPDRLPLCRTANSYTIDCAPTDPNLIGFAAVTSNGQFGSDMAPLGVSSELKVFPSGQLTSCCNPCISNTNLCKAGTTCALTPKLPTIQ